MYNPHRTSAPSGLWAQRESTAQPQRIVQHFGAPHPARLLSLPPQYEESNSRPTTWSLKLDAFSKLIPLKDASSFVAWDRRLIATVDAVPLLARLVSSAAPSAPSLENITANYNFEAKLAAMYAGQFVFGTAVSAHHFGVYDNEFGSEEPSVLTVIRGSRRYSIGLLREEYDSLFRGIYNTATPAGVNTVTFDTIAARSPSCQPKASSASHPKTSPADLWEGNPFEDPTLVPWADTADGSASTVSTCSGFSQPQLQR